MEGLDPEGKTKDTFRFFIRNTDSDRDFSFHIKRDKFIMRSGDFDVHVDVRGLVEFYTAQVTYWLCCENSSSYD